MDEKKWATFLVNNGKNLLSEVVNSGKPQAFEYTIDLFKNSAISGDPIAMADFAQHTLKAINKGGSFALLIEGIGQGLLSAKDIINYKIDPPKNTVNLLESWAKQAANGKTNAKLTPELLGKIFTHQNGSMALMADIIKPFCQGDSKLTKDNIKVLDQWLRDLLPQNMPLQAQNEGAAKLANDSKYRADFIRQYEVMHLGVALELGNNIDANTQAKLEAFVDIARQFGTKDIIKSAYDMGIQQSITDNTKTAKDILPIILSQGYKLCDVVPAAQQTIGKSEKLAAPFQKLAGLAMSSEATEMTPMLRKEIDKAREHAHTVEKKIAQRIDPEIEITWRDRIGLPKQQQAEVRGRS